MSVFERFFTSYEGMNNDVSGAYSSGHLVVVLSALAVYFSLGIFFGLKYKDRADKSKVIKWAGSVMIFFELVRIITDCIDNGFSAVLSHLPLFICSTFLLVLPLIVFTKGRFQQGMIDFIYVFGIFSAIVGTVCAVPIYSTYPIFHVQPICSLITHACAGFAWAFIAAARMEAMTKKTLPYTLGGLVLLITLALCIDLLFRDTGFQNNYMFLFRDDGTPFMILSNWFGKETVGYTIASIVLQLILVPFSYLRVKIVRMIKKTDNAKNDESCRRVLSDAKTNKQ